MNVLVVGSGGREHALAWKLAKSPRADRVFVARGNAGTEVDAENVDISPTDITRLVDFAKQNDVGLTVIGPEAPLAAGVVDGFQTEKAPRIRSHEMRSGTRSKQGLLQEPAAGRRRTHGGPPRIPFGRKRSTIHH